MMSIEIHKKWNVIVPVGSGTCRACWDHHKTLMKPKSDAGETKEVARPNPNPDSDPLLEAGDHPILLPVHSTPPPAAPIESTLQEEFFPPSPVAGPSQTPQDSPQTYLHLAIPSSSDSDSSIPVTDKSWAPTPASKSELAVLNRFLEAGRYDPVKWTLTTPLESASESTVRYYKQKVSEAFSLSLHLLASSQEDKLMKLVIENELRKAPEPEKNIGDLLDTLIKCYNTAEQWFVKRQILSIFASKYTKTELMRMVPGLTVYRIDEARKHARMTGEALPVDIQPIHRCGLDDANVDHFLDFISRLEFVQDVAFGTKKIKLSHGEIFELPNVVRTVISSRIIDLYTQYCAETNFQPLKRTTLYNIISVCEASKKVSLAGLDNIAEEGANGFKILQNTTQLLVECGMPSPWQQDVTSALKQSQLYLKTDYKLHLAIESPCPDHCLKYALCDKPNCSTNHDVWCSNCDSFRKILDKIAAAFDDPRVKYMHPSRRDEIWYDFEQARKSVSNLRSHIVRKINQERGKEKILDDLRPGEGLLIMDWAMKFLPTRFRKSQQDGYGKKGISWHVSALVTRPKVEDDYEIHCFVHLIEKCTQNWYSVISIVEATLCELKTRLPIIRTLDVRSDNAGCYHSASTILAMSGLSERHNIKVARYDFSEAQAGKDICDRKIVSLKSHIQRYINEEIM
ncbi:hypothetical protein SNE40_000459 [Patella caerulea]|uniref:Uncharacterized protein n=1 Tax=Patella caerulea TaxID=87958 RepID=A0AAN8KC97_PATCE